MPRLRLTTENVNRLPFTEAGQVLYLDDAGRGGRTPALQGFGLRVGTKSKAYFVEKRVEGRTVRVTLGLHGHLTADQARDAAVIALGEMTKGADLNKAKQAKTAARRADKASTGKAANYTVSALCDWYITHQTGQGKQSAKDAEGLFAKYVEGTEYASLPARELTAKQATAMIRTVIEHGHKRTAAKLRAYLRAAYALALGAENNAQAPAALVLFDVDTNPIASTAPIKNANGTRHITLTDGELGEVVRLLRSRRETGHDDALAALELSLLLGGQRLAQVLRLTVADVDMAAETVTLYDPKGRRETARKHVLPLTAPAVELLEKILKVRRAEWLFGDKSAPTTPDTVARKGVELLAQAQVNVANAIKGKTPSRPKIQARDLRRTAETMLAAMGISKDVRAQLLSHGLGGVQGRHYDQHEYMTEKRQALQAWADRLQALAHQTPVPDNVTIIRRAA
ncbi:MAG: integrase family protein [Rhodoferax sp.]|nr:integrase family protein [Rhodoferax sp.]